MIRILHVSLLVVLCAGGVFVSGLLLQDHLDHTAAPEWFRDACGQTQGQDVSNCEKVIQSEWGTVLGMPSAYWGMSYYLGLGIWFLFIGQPSFSKRYWHALPTLIALVGAAAAVFFIVIMYTHLEQRCFWCLVSHVITFAILALTLLLWPRRREAVPAAAPAVTGPPPEDSTTVPDPPAAKRARKKPDEAEPPTRVLILDGDAQSPSSERAKPSLRATPIAPTPHPTTHLVIVTLAAVLFASGWLWQGVRAEAFLAQNRKYAQTLELAKQDLEEFRSNVRLMFQMYETEAEQQITIRADDPVTETAPGKNHITAVVFSDFTCSHCRHLAKFMDDEVRPLFKGQLRILYKQVPAGKDCNPFLNRDLHPHACTAARAAEAARIQGGSEAFWKAHDILFKAAGYKLLAKLDYRKVAEQLGLNPDRFVADMNSDAVTRRIAEDVKLAKALRIRGTPAIFILGKKVKEVSPETGIPLAHTGPPETLWDAREVPRAARMQIEFWKEAHRRFQILTANRRSTRARTNQAPTPTPGTPGRPDAE
jgi:protein-disulfide isomerase/uncharacterized membrane protein